jgi:hypothetical protein
MDINGVDDVPAGHIAVGDMIVSQSGAEVTVTIIDVPGGALPLSLSWPDGDGGYLTECHQWADPVTRLPADPGPPTRRAA